MVGGVEQVPGARDQETGEERWPLWIADCGVRIWELFMVDDGLVMGGKKVWERAGQGASSDVLRMFHLRSIIAGLKSFSLNAFRLIFQLSKIVSVSGEQEPGSS